MECLLNLLPPEKKKLLNRMYLILYFRFIIEIVLFYSVIVATSLVLVSYFLDANLQIVQEKTASLERGYGQINQEIKKVNQDLENLSLILSSFRDWSAPLAEIIKNVPSNISLNGLNLNQTNKTLNVQGLAKTREDLLNFKEKLAQSALVKKIEIPVSSLITKENISFSLTAEINLP